MAENENGQDKTEDATPERRQEFREKGQIAISRELSSVMILAITATVLGLLAPYMGSQFANMFKIFLYRVRDYRVDLHNFAVLSTFTWKVVIELIIPTFLISFVIAVLSTFMQTGGNWSWTKVSPDFNRLNPFKGLTQMVNTQAVMNTFKSIGKVLAISYVAYIVLRKEWYITPGLMGIPIESSFGHWTEMTMVLVWGVSILLLVIAAIDYAYNYRQMENQLKMSKEEVKEDIKKQEVDPHVKNRMKKMQRDIVFAKTISATKTASAVITNPTHYAIAIKYELGMKAPVIVAKGKDHIALQMRAVAKDAKVPIIENKPLARLLYRVCEVGQEIPENLYRAVSEIIRYVFKLKGKALTRTAPLKKSRKVVVKKRDTDQRPITPL